MDKYSTVSARWPGRSKGGWWRRPADLVTNCRAQNVHLRFAADHVKHDGFRAHVPSLGLHASSPIYNQLVERVQICTTEISDRNAAA